MEHPRRILGGITAPILALGLVAAPIVASPANAADDVVNLNLIGINDFHGRIDANTVKFAGTVENVRAQYGDANSLFVSGGDNIGASVFASASADDDPTIDVLNALGMQASAVGNHEFDKGYADLTGRVQSRAKWAYLGANVYNKGTTTPALPSYETFDVAGVTIGVIGVVTQETPTLVTPAGIKDLDFGDPVDAVNRVATQLTDGDASNGEAQVIVAAYHEGAPNGEPEGATLDSQVAASPVFKKIVEQTSPKVSAIFTGHTHKKYAWEAPVPGDATGATRPIIQTGSYGENVGQVVLQYDKTTNAVISHTQRNVARTSEDDGALTAKYPRVAQVKTIVDAALAAANEIGKQPVGSVTANITTAFVGGKYEKGVYTVGTGTDGLPIGRDDRSKESTLGNLIADSLVASLGSADRGGAEIGVVNPGGIRSELYKSYPAAEDGTITYAEANAVLPFLNNLWTTTLTGAQFKTVLEQQWQTNADGTVPSRPFLNLGLSKNVSYTYDATRAQGDHITSITVNGAPIDLAKNYRIGSFSFLLQGGDNFREFKSGANTSDSGLIDRDAWIAYLEANPGTSPSFARRGVQVTGVPATAERGSQVSFQLGNLDLTSLGSPENTSVDIALDGGAALGSVPVTAGDPGNDAMANGTANVSFTVPQDAPDNLTLVLTAMPSNTVVRVPLAVVNAAPVTPPTTTPPAAAPAPGGSLANTGSDATPALWLGGIALLLGAGALSVRRRQRA